MQQIECFRFFDYIYFLLFLQHFHKQHKFYKSLTSFYFIKAFFLLKPLFSESRVQMLCLGSIKVLSSPRRKLLTHGIGYLCSELSVIPLGYPGDYCSYQLGVALPFQYLIMDSVLEYSQLVALKYTCFSTESISTNAFGF